jgi:protoporphyrinogen oxidase
MRVGILGGGISGLTLQRFLQHPSEVLEKATVPGGLCRTFWKDGFGYDIGGHILFSKHQHVNDFVNEVLGANINYCRRANKILYNGRYVKYPFENDLGALDKRECYECLVDYLKNDAPEPTNFAEWAHATFGRAIAEKYLIPYNRKIWKMEPAAMGMEWVGRVPKPPVEDVIKSALGIETEGYTHQLYFRYPLHGGFEAVVKAIVQDESRVHLDTAARSIIRLGDRWIVSDGRREWTFDRLVIAFPIREALRCFQDIPAEVAEAVHDLRYNSLRVALVAVNNESLMDKSAVYIPDPTVLTHRVCFMGFFSPNMVRPGTSSLVAEITTRQEEAADRLSNGAFLDTVVSDLDRIGIINKQDVIVTDTKRIEYGYPVYDANYSRNVETIRKYFTGLGVDQLGRFGEFDYINSDECIHRAMQLAHKLNALPARDGHSLDNLSNGAIPAARTAS